MTQFKTICSATSGSVTVDYPAGVGVFSLPDNPYPSYLFANDDGSVIVSNTTPEGAYYIVARKTIGAAVHDIPVCIIVQGCLSMPYKLSYEFCINSGNQTRTIKLDKSNPTNFIKTSVEAWSSISSNGVLTINTSHESISLNTVYNIVFTADSIAYTIQVVMRNCASPTLKSRTDCADDNSFAIVWINQAGGRSSYWFNQNKVYELRISDGKTFINESQELRYASRGEVYDAIDVSQQLIPIQDSELIKTLLCSIQAWRTNNIGDISKWVPIIIDESSTKLVDLSSEFQSVSFSLRDAKAKQIQKQ